MKGHPTQACELMLASAASRVLVRWLWSSQVFFLGGAEAMCGSSAFRRACPSSVFSHSVTRSVTSDITAGGMSGEAGQAGCSAREERSAMTLENLRLCFLLLQQPNLGKSKRDRQQGCWALRRVARTFPLSCTALLLPHA